MKLVIITLVITALNEGRIATNNSAAQGVGITVCTNNFVMFPMTFLSVYYISMYFLNVLVGLYVTLATQINSE